MSEKEVYYHRYCRQCEYRNASEADDPCDECLAQPVNEDSHKPVYFKQASKKEARTKRDQCCTKSQS